MSTPVPPGRNRWRLTLHKRAYAANLDPVLDLFLAEVMDWRSLNLVQKLNYAAQLVFALDGTSAAASLIEELTTDVVAWRWDEVSGKDIAVFRGLVAQAVDSLSETVDTVTFTAHDYETMTGRRLLGGGVSYQQLDQDSLVSSLLNLAQTVPYTSYGESLLPGSYFPLTVDPCYPDGSQSRPLSGQLRDRAYAAQTDLEQAFEELAAVQGGFDWDVVPGLRYTSHVNDQLRIFYPNQGVDRPDVVLEYGGSVASLTRSTNSADFANYWRVIGASSDPTDSTAPPLWSDAIDPSATDVVTYPQGLFMSGDNASDVTIQATLDQKAQGDLAASFLEPAYTLGLTPGAYSWGNPNMGDTVRLIVNAGRLDEDTSTRVVGITYDAGDAGQEDVTLALGRASLIFPDLFTAQKRDINALARR